MIEFFLCTSSAALQRHWQNALENKGVEIATASDLETYAWNAQSILLIDIQHHSGLAEKLLQKSRAHSMPKVFALTGEPDLNQGLALLQQGVKGYGNAYISVQNLKTAIDVIQSDHIWIYPELVQYLIVQTKPAAVSTPSSLTGLTDKERETAKYIAKGMSNKEVAQAMHITERTVKAHLSSIYKKLDISDRFSLALLLKGIHE